MWSSLPSQPRRGLQVVGFLVVTLGVGAFGLPALGRMDERTVGIVELELMRTTSKAQELLALLAGDGIDAARTSIYLDFPFLILYGATLSAACVLVAARASEKGMDLFEGLGKALAPVAVIAAALDALENVALLVVLDGHPDQPWPGLAFAFASVKFVLLGVVVLFVLGGLLATRRRAAT
jgi:hypothetical protein